MSVRSLRCGLNRLIEADWSHFESVFCISVGYLGWCEVDDWKSNVFVGCELEDC